MIARRSRFIHERRSLGEHADYDRVTYAINNYRRDKLRELIPRWASIIDQSRAIEDTTIRPQPGGYLESINP